MFSDNVKLIEFPAQQQFTLNSASDYFSVTFRKIESLANQNMFAIVFLVLFFFLLIPSKQRYFKIVEILTPFKIVSCLSFDFHVQ